MSRDVRHCLPFLQEFCQNVSNYVLGRAVSQSDRAPCGNMTNELKMHIDELCTCLVVGDTTTTMPPQSTSLCVLEISITGEVMVSSLVLLDKNIFEISAYLEQRRKCSKLGLGTPIPLLPHSRPVLPLL